MQSVGALAMFHSYLQHHKFYPQIAVSPKVKAVEAVYLPLRKHVQANTKLANLVYGKLPTAAVLVSGDGFALHRFLPHKQIQIKQAHLQLQHYTLHPCLRLT